MAERTGSLGGQKPWPSACHARCHPALKFKHVVTSCRRRQTTRSWRQWSRRWKRSWSQGGGCQRRWQARALAAAGGSGASSFGAALIAALMPCCQAVMLCRTIPEPATITQTPDEWGCRAHTRCSFPHIRAPTEDVCCRDVIFLDIALEAAIRGVVESSLTAVKAATSAGVHTLCRQPNPSAQTLICAQHVVRMQSH